QEARQLPDAQKQQAVQPLARRQEALNREASRLPADRNPKGLEQARAAMNEAQQDLDRGDTAHAGRKQAEAAQALDRLAQRQLARTPRGEVQASGGREPPGGPDVLRQARELGQRQEELNRRLEPLADNPEAEAAQQQGRQQDLQQQAGSLAQDLNRLAQQLGR